MASYAERPETEEAKQEERTNGIDGHDSAVSRDDSQQPSFSPQALKRTSTTPHLSTTSSAVTSPKPSREGSPIRPPLKPGSASTTRLPRSRKNSQDLSPIRAPGAPSIPNVPSAASIQRALAAIGTPHIPPLAIADSTSDPPRSQKANKASSQQTGSSIPRLTSPPPAASSGSNKSVLSATRKVDQSQSTPSTPTIVVDRPARSSTFSSDSEAGEEDRPLKSGMRTPVRGISGNGPPLETVQESSLPSTPAIGAARSAQTGKGPLSDRPERIDENPLEEALTKDKKSKNESGNESSTKKNNGAKSTEEGKDIRKPAPLANSTKPPVVQPKKSFSQLPFTKSKVPTEGSVKNMTVETETVSSIPQVALGGGAGERNNVGRTDTGGSLRLKPSNETIRPKKEKKRVVRKAPSGNGGFSFRHFHYHHDSARPPSPEVMLPLSANFYGMTHARVLSSGQPTFGLLPGNLEEKCKQILFAELSPAKTRDTQKRTRTLLTHFRGRTVSSKADIFEAKVASAVDEANSSDSEETFVYESNPPEPHWARPHRFHSRTPSATSMISQIDHHGAKGRADGNHGVVGKKSMKFSNNYNSIGYSKEGDGTVRGPSQSGRNASNNTTYHHHIGRHGRGGHASLFDNDSPFPNATKSPRSATGHPNQHSPRHSSPRSPHVMHITKSPRKVEEVLSYDLEDEGADDERTPLVGSVRVGRNRRRPLPGSVRHMYAEERGHRLCGRATAFTVLGIVLTSLIAAIVAVVILCSKPLLEVYIKDIRNVLASEQEIMLDLHVRATNPNIVAVQVSDLDLNLFAKGKHVGTGSLWRAGHLPTTQPSRKSDHIRASSSKTSPALLNPTDIVSKLDGVDEGTDPIDDIDDPAADSQTMLLGQIFEFDSPLIFDPSPIRHRSLGSVGEVRLAKPGNKTEEGGSLRWEHVLQHDFELIARGVVRYSLPVSSRMYSASIAGRVVVHPNDSIDEAGNMRISKPDSRFEQGSNVLLSSPARRKFEERRV